MIMSDATRRREVLKILGGGAAALGAAFAAPSLVARTAHGELLEYGQEYGGFLVEKIAPGHGVYEYDPEVLQPMSQKQTVFSRNVWDPARKNRPSTTEDLEHDRLVVGKGRVPNQTRLDYALQAASWATADMGGEEKQYAWTTQCGEVKNLERLGLGRWDPADLNMNWDDARNAVKHAALFYGASLAGVAELNPLWLYTDCFSPVEEDKGRAIPVLRKGRDSSGPTTPGTYRNR